MIVIFMSKEAKTCNTIFSRQKKKKKELSIKCTHIFDLNIWMLLVQRDHSSFGWNVWEKETFEKDMWLQRVRGGCGVL